MSNIPKPSEIISEKFRGKLYNLGLDFRSLGIDDNQRFSSRLHLIRDTALSKVNDISVEIVDQPLPTRKLAPKTPSF
jgi:hypothetical protein